MKPQQLFPALLFFAMTFLAVPDRAQMAAGPMTRVVRPNTPQNIRLLTAIEAGYLLGVQDALQSGANADAEAGWEIPAMDVPPLPAQTFGNPRSFTELAVEDSTWQRDKYLPIFRLLLHSLPALSFTDPQKAVVLMYSSVNMNDLESARWLVARDVNINSPFPGAPGILSAALFTGGDMRIKTVSPLMAFLLDHGAQVNAAGIDSMTPLMIAAQYGKVDVVRVLLAHSADPALRDKRGLTALDWASRMGQDDAVALLRDRSPMDIYEAAQFGDVPRLRAHLDAGEDPNAPDTSGTTPLMKAATSGSLPTLRLLLARGADVRQKRKDGTTALHMAAMYGYAPLAALLLDRGADINAVGNMLNRPASPLTCAVNQVQPNTVTLLLKRGADWKHGVGEAALDTAIQELGSRFIMRPVGMSKSRLPHGSAASDARLQIIDLLLDAGVSLRSNDSHALFLAAHFGQGGLVEYLLSKGADPNGRGEFIPAYSPNYSRVSDWNSGETALMGAIEAWALAGAEEKNIKADQAVLFARQSVRLLLAHGANVNRPDAHGATPLMLCVYYGQDVLAEMLLTRAAKIDAADVNGKTALMREVSGRRPLLAAWLLAHHASINRRDKLGRTALMLTIDDGANDSYRARPAWARMDSPVPQKDLPNPDGHPETVRLLLQHGASVNAVALDGSTAVSLARKQGFGQVVTLLTEAGARR